MQETKKFGLSNNALKIIAMLSMLIDHVGLQIFPEHQIFRIIGRLAFPIFAYMIAEGCFYTKNRKKYLLIVAGLGIACQAVYAIVAHSLYQNTLITFALSIAIIFSVDNFSKEKTKVSLLIMSAVIISAIFLSLIAPALFENEGFEIDYGFLGMILPVAVYFSPTKTAKTVSMCLILAGMTVLSKIQIFAFLAVPLILLYNGKRGKLNMKYFFYIFYPAHLVIIYLIDSII